jgi:hypothetical protein
VRLLTGLKRTFTSNSLSDFNSIVRLCDFGFPNNTVHHLVQPPTVVFPMRAKADQTIPFAIHFTSVPYYLNTRPNRTTFRVPGMFFSANPRTVWQQLTDVLIPLWRGMFHIPMQVLK